VDERLDLGDRLHNGRKRRRHLIRRGMIAIDNQVRLLGVANVLKRDQQLVDATAGGESRSSQFVDVARLMYGERRRGPTGDEQNDQ
jgi:hypothetical protein